MDYQNKLVDIGYYEGPINVFISTESNNLIPKNGIQKSGQSFRDIQCMIYNYFQVLRSWRRQFFCVPTYKRGELKFFSKI